MSHRTRLYVGNLPPGTRSQDVDDLFYKYGRIRYIDLKSGLHGPSYAFVEFDDPRDAEDAMYKRDGYNMDGSRIRVEFCRGSRSSGRDRYDGRSRYGPPIRRSEYKVSISGIPRSGSWQDLKDHMRDVGEVCFADVFRDGTGIVEFSRHRDIQYAIDKMNGSKFTSHEGESGYIQVRAYSPTSSSSHRRSRSRSVRRRGSRTPPRRSGSKRERSPSPRRSDDDDRNRRRSSSSRSLSPVAPARQSESPAPRRHSQSPPSPPPQRKYESEDEEEEEEEVRSRRSGSSSSSTGSASPRQQKREGAAAMIPADEPVNRKGNHEDDEEYGQADDMQFD